MNKSIYERRYYAFEIRAEQNDDDVGIVTGRPIVYDSKTDLGDWFEIIDRGALKGADLKDVRFLVNHNTDMIPLARSRNNNANSTMQLTVDDDGLAIRVNLDVENNSDAKSLYSAIRRGDISGMSFMFRVDGEAWEDLDSEKPLRRITSISNVIEVSAVTFPAYDATTITARNKDALDNARAALESAKQAHREKLESEQRDALELEKAKSIFYLSVK